MVKLLGISGSLRKGSFNTALLRAAQRVAGPDIASEIATLDGVPLYNADDETATGIPPAVQALKARVMAADGVLVATPEYNSGVPGVLKNGIDWLSRPHTDISRVFAGRPFAVFGATPSGYGTALSQNAWLTVAADPRILFDVPAEERLPAAMQLLGIDFASLSEVAGHA